MSEETTENQRKELLRDLVAQVVGLLAEIDRLRAELKKARRRGVEKGDYLTIVAGNAEIIVKHDDDGVAVDIWSLEDAKADSPLGSTWVTHNELQGDEC